MPSGDLPSKTIVVIVVVVVVVTDESGVLQEVLQKFSEVEEEDLYHGSMKDEIHDCQDVRGRGYCGTNSFMGPCVRVCKGCGRLLRRTRG